MTKHRLLTLAALILSARLCALDGGLIPLSDRPAWIRPQSLNITDGIDHSLVDSGFYYILNDQQMSISPREHYRHFAFRIISHAGLEEASRLELSWEPAFETLALYGFKVYRNGETIDYRNRLRWKELQKEDALADGQYDETKTMLLVLEDIREGDVVEYEYATRGSNPIFGSTFYGVFSHGLDYPMANLSFRLVVPPRYDIRVRQHVRELKESIIDAADGGKEYFWSERNSPAVETDAYTPDWYDEWPWIEISEWRDWNQVRDWGRTVFKDASKPGPELKKTWEKLTRDDGESQGRERALERFLRFTQDEIRYFGIEIGVNSHKPHNPDEVLKNRFGDCKDKALLFCQLARLSGWEAWPVLVNSGSGRMVGEWLPSPRAFNHVIAAVRDGDAWLWFDPTLSYQGGTIDRIPVPDYGQVLMLDNSTAGLLTMPAETAGEIEVRESYISKGYDGPGKLEVKTVYRGHEADRMRYRLASTGRVNLEKSYLEFYQASFPEATKIDDISSKDDREENELEVFESYELPGMWKKKDGDDEPCRLFVTPYAFSDRFDDYDDLDTDRKGPLKLSYPIRISHHITVYLPSDIDIDDEDYTAENKWYALTFASRKDGLMVELDYTYEPRVDSVPAAEFAEFRDAMKEDNATYIGYTLTEPVDTKDDGKVGDSILAGVMVWLLIITAIVAYLIGFYRGERRGRGNV